METLVPVISLTFSPSFELPCCAKTDPGGSLRPWLCGSFPPDPPEPENCVGFELWPTCPEATRVREVPRRSRSM